MPPTYSPQTVLSTEPFVLLNPETNRSPQDEAGAVFDQLRTVLSRYLERPDRAELWQQLLAAQRSASDTIARLPKKEGQGVLAQDARQLIKEISKSGVHDQAVAAAELKLLESYAKKGWPGLLASMLLVPAWQWPTAPLLMEVPEWLLGDYVQWLFSAPQGFCELGQAEKYAAYTLRRLEELVRWMKRSPSVDLESAVLGAYVRHASAIPLYFSEGSLRRHAELRGQLLLRALGQPGDHYDPPVRPRLNRRLRVAFINRHFSSQTETYCTLPTFEELDPERFEVSLYCHQSSGSNLEEHCRLKTTGLTVLPEDFEAQLAMLRAAALDVVVFGTNITAVCNEVLRLALHRIAPLQVINNSSCITSGLAEADLYVSGALTEIAEAPTHFSERLGLVPGPTHAFNYQADHQEPQAVCHRSYFGLPEDALVFVSAANYFKVVPEIQHAWAKLLAAVPGSCLLLHPFNPNWSSSYPSKRFRAELERVLASHGVDASRLAISSEAFPSRTDVKTLLGLGNIYLDSFPFGGVNSLVDPLELGMPVVAWEGDTMRARMGGSLLRTLELTEMIAGNAADYQRIAVKLATDATYRQETGARIQAKMERLPLFLDSLASSEALGALLETAFDELVAVGRKAFRQNPVPLQAATAPAVAQEKLSADPEVQARLTLRSAPADAMARYALGHALLAAGRTSRAVSYLLAAIQGVDDNPGLWLDLARALKADGRTSEAIQALEASLRMNEQQLEGWLMLAELAQTVGVLDLARDAAGIAQKLDPTDMRASAYL